MNSYQLLHILKEWIQLWQHFHSPYSLLSFQIIYGQVIYRHVLPQGLVQVFSKKKNTLWWFMIYHFQIVLIVTTSKHIYTYAGWQLKLYQICFFYYFYLPEDFFIVGIHTYYTLGRKFNINYNSISQFSILIWHTLKIHISSFSKLFVWFFFWIAY